MNISEKEAFLGFLAVFGLGIGSALIHECSHKNMVNILYKNSNPSIGCSSYFPIPVFCNTWNPEAVVRSEFPITWKTARGLVAAAGPVCDVSNIAISSIIAWKMISCNKRISLLFAVHAFDLACNICLYSFSGIIFPDNSNDFVNVEANLGISRYVQTTITVALVFATFTLLNNLSV